MVTDRFTTDGIVLSERRFGESSKFIDLFTRERGVLSVLIKGAYRRNSSFVSISQPYTEGRFRLEMRGTVAYIKDWGFLHSLGRARGSYQDLLAAGVLAEIVMKTLHGGETNKKAYDLFAKTLRVLEEGNVDRNLILAAFLMKYISFLGYRPSLKRCISCTVPVKNPSRYDVFGGVLCDKCPGHQTHPLENGEDFIYYFEKILYTSLDKLNEIEVNSPWVSLIFRLMVETLQYHLDIKEFVTLQLYP